MRRLVLAGTGVLLAFLAGGCVLTVALAVESTRVPAQTSLAIVNVAALVMASLHDGSAGPLIGAGLEAVWLALIMVCFLPVAFAALVAEAAGLRSLVWSAGATGALAAAVPTVLRGLAADGSTLATTPEEARITVILFLTGVASGSVYWLVAGRRSDAKSTWR